MKLKDNCDIKEIKGVSPASECLVSLRVSLLRLNPSLFGSGSECNVLSVTQVRNNTHVYQAVLQVDTEFYKRIMNFGSMFLGYDSCRVYLMRLRL